MSRLSGTLMNLVQLLRAEAEEHLDNEEVLSAIITLNDN